MAKFYVETRCDGLPWTRQGCNAWSGPRRATRRSGLVDILPGKHVPYASEADALAAIERLRGYASEPNGDPMWASAEYRIVPAKGAK